IPLFCFTMGIALLFAVSNVFFNDTQHLSGVILQAVYFLCPILYGREHLPAWLVKWLVANPLFSIIEMNRSIFYYGLAPDPREYLIVCATSLLFLGLGLWVFKKADNKFIYFV
ncbi:MAG: ABC transporter permease, partial [Bdellovibrionales bacterium]|nr:ABC transporter permease [Bdellovibrionales bacterium]